MQLKIKILNYLKTINLSLLLLIFSQIDTIAQDVVTVDSTGVAKDNEVLVDEISSKKDSVPTFKKFKAEGVSAVVGDFVILEFDIDKSYLDSHPILTAIVAIPFARSPQRINADNSPTVRSFELSNLIYREKNI